MIDWTKSMQQTFEFYLVDPNTWTDKEQLLNIVSASIDRDESLETLGSASIECTSLLNECYIRIYLIAIQNGYMERFPLATVLAQTPGDSFDGKNHTYAMDAYTPLLELKEKPTPIGYTVKKDRNIMDVAAAICRSYMRAPVVPATSSLTLKQNFVANSEDTWLSYLKDMIKNAEFKFELDPEGVVLFAPVQDIQSLRPVWTYSDDDQSILFADISVNRDLYGVPNVVEVIYSRGNETLTSRVVNKDRNSPISTVNRGREIVHRITDPNIPGTATQDVLDRYAEQELRNLSCLEYTISYTHGYCPVRLGDCVRINYSRAGITDVIARVTRQTIKCTVGCSVSETAVFTTKLWG